MGTSAEVSADQLKDVIELVTSTRLEVDSCASEQSRRVLVTPPRSSTGVVEDTDQRSGIAVWRAGVEAGHSDRKSAHGRCAEPYCAVVGGNSAYADVKSDSSGRQRRRADVGKRSGRSRELGPGQSRAACMTA